MGAKERPSWYSYHGDIWRATKCTLQKLLRYRLRAGYHAIHIYISDDVLSCIPYLKAAKDRFRKIGERPNWAVSHYKIRVLGENAPKIHSIVHKYRYIREIPGQNKRRILERCADMHSALTVTWSLTNGDS